MPMFRTVTSKVKSISPEVTTACKLCISCNKVVNENGECDCESAEGKTLRINPRKND